MREKKNDSQNNANGNYSFNLPVFFSHLGAVETHREHNT